MLLILTCTPCTAQEWQWARHAGGPLNERGWIGGVGSAGEVYLYGNYGFFDGPPGAGCSFGDVHLDGTKDGFIAKYAADGELQWARAIRSPTFASVSRLRFAADSSSIYVMFGYSGTCDLDTVSLTTLSYADAISQWTLDGHCLWARNISAGYYFPEQGTSSVYSMDMDLDGDGNLFISAYSGMPSGVMVGGQPVARGPIICKFGAMGDLIWLKQVDGIGQGRMDFYTVRSDVDRIYVHGKAYLPQGGIFVVDTIMVSGPEGEGMALGCFNAANGHVEWFNLDGFPNAYSVARHGMDIGADGNLHCIGVFYGTTNFLSDTLIGSDQWASGYMATYAPDGTHLAATGLAGTGFFGPRSVKTLPTGDLLVTGSFAGQFEVGGSSHSATTEQDMFLLRCNAEGVPQAFARAGTGDGYSVAYHDGAILVCGIFPEGYPFVPAPSTITFGSEVLTSIGGSDIFLAKLGMLASAPAAMATATNRLIIHANPNQGSFRLVLPEDLRNARDLTFRVYDATGRLANEQMLHMDEERPRVDVWDTAPGFYMVTVSDGDRTYSGSMVVE